MPSGPGSPWRPRAPHTAEAHPYVRAALRVGFGREVIWSGIASRERARLMKQGLFNAAKGQRPPVSVSAEIEPGGSGDWRIRFVVHSKSEGRAYVAVTYGKDRSQWPYRAARGNQ